MPRSVVPHFYFLLKISLRIFILHPLNVVFLLRATQKDGTIGAVLCAGDLSSDSIKWALNGSERKGAVIPESYPRVLLPAVLHLCRPTPMNSMQCKDIGSDKFSEFGISGSNWGLSEGVPTINRHCKALAPSWEVHDLDL